MENTYYYSAVADIQMLNKTTVSDRESEVFSNDSSDRKPTRSNGNQNVGSAKSDAKIVKSFESDAKSSSSVDDVATSVGRDPNFLKDGEVFETDTFDDRYSRNIKRTQHYMEKLLSKMEGNFRNSWSISKIFTSPQRSKEMKESKETSRKSKEEDCEYADTPDTSSSSPTFLLRSGTYRENTQIQIPDRALPGNVFYLGRNHSRSMIMACRTVITTISTLNAVCFCIGRTPSVVRDIAARCASLSPTCYPFAQIVIDLRTIL